MTPLVFSYERNAPIPNNAITKGISVPISSSGNGLVSQLKVAIRNIKNLPKWKFENNGKVEMCDTDLEMWCGEEVNKFLVSRDLKRKLNKKIIYEQNKELWEYSFKGVKKLEQKHLISFVNGVAKAKVENNENWKNVTAILNTLPFDKALEIYRKH